MPATPICTESVLQSSIPIGCPDTMNGTPTEDTLVQSAFIGAIGVDTVTLNWDAPTDTVGLLGVTISEASNTAGSLLPPVEVVAAVTTYTVTDLEPNTAYLFSITTRYTASGKNNSRTVSAMTISATAVQNITVSGTNTTVLTLAWQNPVDTADYTEVMITAEPAAGNIATPQSVAIGTATFAVTGLTAGTPYRFTFATIYSDGKSGSSTTFTVKTLTAASIDADADTLIDITSLERLHNMRHTLDGSSYKTSSTDPGSQCGSNGATACTGYELTRSLDFTDAASYDGSIPNAMRMWRPNSMADNTGSILPQALADDGTNNGWNPIGNYTTPFNSRLEGNGHTIHNLYGRRSTAGRLGLFGDIGSNSVIRSIGVATVYLYGSDSDDDIGALVGVTTGTIVASYASGVVNGGAGDDRIGGLAGSVSENTGRVIASYASGTVNGDAGADNVGGLIGIGTSNLVIIAAYASGTVNGGANNDRVGGLVGVTNGFIAMATYAGGTVNGNAGNDTVGGFGGGLAITSVLASYATGTANGGANSDTVGSIGVDGGTVFTATYGFGTSTNFDTAGFDGTARTGGVAGVGDGIVGARTLTLANAGVQWNEVDITATPVVTTMDAWDFGTAAQAPVLKYADYDGTEDTYGCIDATTPTSTATIVIPSIVATPTGPKRIICGTTPLPEQVR